MWRFLIAWLAILLPFSGAMAAERVLLHPQGQTPMARSAAGSASMQALRQDAAEDGRVAVIIGLKVPFAPEGTLPAAEVREQREDIAEATDTLSSRFAAAINRAPNAHREFDTVPIMALEVTPAELERLARDPNVISITANRRNSTNLLQSVPLVQGNLAQAAGFTGAGQTIAIIDTGVDGNHPFLAGKVVSEACYSTTSSTSASLCPRGVPSSVAPGSGRPCARRGCEHGTHVAGIAAGSNSTMKGVAPDASIIAIQVFSREGNKIVAWDSDIIAGLARAYELRNQYSIAAVNLSLGGGAFTSACDSHPQIAAYMPIISNLRTAGIATVASSGNDGRTNAIGAPACLSNVVSVGAVSTRNWGLCGGTTATAQDKVACYSNSAGFLSLLAPGSPITSSIPNGAFAAYHGTSMAAPHVAGAWALIKQKMPNATVDQVLSTLRSTGLAVVDDRNNVTTRRINVMAALNAFNAPDRLLTFTRNGAGAGRVAFSPAGSLPSCDVNCTSTFSGGEKVTLTATPLAGSTFGGWTGCSGTGPVCSVIMSAARSVTATFNRLPTFALSYTKAGAGAGRVTFTSAGGQASCSGSCSQDFALGTTVTLTPVAEPGSVFTGWRGDCSRPALGCVVTMSKAQSVTATFAQLRTFSLTYVASGSGTGTVNMLGVPGTEPCTGNCTRSFGAGTRITLTAVASPGSTFAGWSGACARRPTCEIRMNQALTIRANFIRNNAMTSAGLAD